MEPANSSESSALDLITNSIEGEVHLINPMEALTDLEGLLEVASNLMEVFILLGVFCHQEVFSLALSQL